jgi:hypothetical protein
MSLATQERIFGTMMEFVLSTASLRVEVGEEVGLVPSQRHRDAPFFRSLPLCQRSCRPDRIGTFGGADIRKWLDTDRRTRIG